MIAKLTLFALPVLGIFVAACAPGLSESVRRGDLQAATAAAQRGEDLNKGDDEGGIPPLFIAVRDGNRQIVEMLLSKGANVNVRNWNQKTPLHLACDKSDQAMADLLVSRGADVNVRDRNQQTPLYMAFEKSAQALVDLLVSRGADVNLPDKDGVSPLHLACKKSDRASVSLLIAKGANINAQTRGGETPLHSLANCYCDENKAADITAIAEMLMAQGADMNAQTARGESVYGRTYGSGVLAKVLKAHGAAGWTPLLVASEANQLEAVVAQIKVGANVNAKNENGFTPLMFAARGGNLEMARALVVSAGADVTATDRWGRSALHIAALAFEDQDSGLVRGKIEVVKFLVKKGSQIDSVDNDGNSPLNDILQAGAETAAGAKRSRGNSEMALFLLSSGANFRLANKEEDTPAYWAKVNRHPKVVEQLIAQGAKGTDFLPSAKRINAMTERVREAMKVINEGALP
jgi:ankyrin repeat protein